MGSAFDGRALSEDGKVGVTRREVLREVLAHALEAPRRAAHTTVGVAVLVLAVASACAAERGVARPVDDPTVVAASACFGWLEEVVSDAHSAAGTWDELEVAAKDTAEQRGDQRLVGAVDELRRASPGGEAVPAASGDALTEACEAAYGVQLD